MSSRNFPRPFANPFGLEGYKTIAFEIVEQLGSAPDRVFVPVGGGDSIYGVWKGFRELLELGAIDRAPRMYACQAGGASIVRAIEQDLQHAPEVPSVNTPGHLDSAHPVGRSRHLGRPGIEGGGYCRRGWRDHRSPCKAGA